MYEPRDHTFVVCAYKENPFLESTVKTLLEQTVAGKVLISTSTPNDHIRTVGAAHGIPVVVNPQPRLAGDDWNYGYDAADTPLVTIAHQDDYYDPHFLETVLASLNRYEVADVAFSCTDYFEIRDGERVESSLLLNIKRLMNAPLRVSALNGSPFIKKRVLSLGNPICCPAVTLVKPVLGPSVFDTVYKNSCDYKTWVDLAFERRRFVYIPRKLVGHRIYAESSTSLNLADNIRKAEDAEILSALWPRPIARLINSVYALSEKSNEL